MIKDLEENGNKRQALLSQIDTVMVDFAKERSTSTQSNERAQVNTIFNQNSISRA